MTLYTFLGKKGHFYKLNANCSKDVKQGEGPGSCGGTASNISVDDNILRIGDRFFVIVRSNDKIKIPKLGNHSSVDKDGMFVYSKRFEDIEDAKKFQNYIIKNSRKQNIVEPTNNNISSIKTVQNTIFDKVTPKLEKIMNEGDATCPGAAYILSKTLQSMGIKSKIIGGEFDGSGHFWVEIPTNDGTYIADIGNNVLEKTLETGKIENIFTKVDSELGKMYENRDEEYSNPEQFRKEHNDPFSKRSFDTVRKS